MVGQFTAEDYIHLSHTMDKLVEADAFLRSVGLEPSEPLREAVENYRNALGSGSG